MEIDFLDLPSKAKELGISEGVLRARILSGKIDCFAFAANARAYAKFGEWLPPWSEEDFPFIEWIDHGAEFRYNHELASRDFWPPNKTPWYHINGWVALSSHLVEVILTRGECELNNAPIYICDKDGKIACSMNVNAPPKKQWVMASGDHYADGGYMRETPFTLSVDDLFIPSTIPDAAKPLPSRKEQSYLSIIAAMRGLLRDRDGGAFPSEAKIIEQLVARFGTARGVSKRNIETVFAAATRSADDVLSVD